MKIINQTHIVGKPNIYTVLQEKSEKISLIMIQL